MDIQPKTYVENSEGGGVRVAGTRVSLDSVVYMYLEGRDAEEIAHELPVLTLEEVHGAIAFFLGNRPAVEEHLKRQEARWEELRLKCETNNKELRDRLRTRLMERDKASRSA
jgi:uncharacterized protein (DUF433 family)